MKKLIVKFTWGGGGVKRNFLPDFEFDFNFH